MNFSYNELKAIYSITKAMVLADGKMDGREMATVSIGFVKLGVDSEKYNRLSDSNNQIPVSNAIDILSTMDLIKKQYVVGFLAGIMVIDNDIADSEKALLEFVMACLGIPGDELRKCVEIWTNQLK